MNNGHRYAKVSGRKGARLYYDHCKNDECLRQQLKKRKGSIKSAKVEQRYGL